MARKTYTQEFKDGAAKMVLNDGRTHRDVAESLGVDPGSLRQWVRFAKAAGMAKTAAADPSQRIRELEAQVRRLQMEKDILKKAAAYFAREGDPGGTRP
jgi:transposase